MKWYFIGLKLGIDAETLETIEQNKVEIDDRFRTMLTTWLRTVRPTLGALAEALKSPTVGYEQLVETILVLK